MNDQQLRERLNREARAVIEGLPAVVSADPDPWVAQTTAIIKTFERPYFVARLIASIREFYPQLPILVCDDSRLPLYEDAAEPSPGVRWLTLSADAGHTLGAGRNYLLDRAQTPYVFLCDDDHEFVAQTRLQAMWHFLEDSGFDIVGGAQGEDDYGTAVFERRGNRMLQLFHAHHGLVAPLVVACDRVSNTFLGRTEPLRQVRWEEHVYAHEHADFFIRTKEAGLRVAQMGRTWVAHDRGGEVARSWTDRLFGWLLDHRDAHYRIQRLGGKPGESERAARRRAHDLYQRYVLDRHGVSEIRDDYSRSRRQALEQLIGRPGDPVPS